MLIPLLLAAGHSSTMMRNPGAHLWEGVARIFDPLCEADPPAFALWTSFQRLTVAHCTVAAAHTPWETEAPIVPRVCAVWSGITAQALITGERRRICQASRASAVGPTHSMACRLDLRLRVNCNMQIVTIPELLNLSVPRRPRGPTGGTACLTSFPRIGWDRHGR